MEAFIILSYLLVVSNVTQKLLILSGVELNPGPSTLDKTTTKKDKEVHRPFSAPLGQSQNQNASVQIPSNPYSSINLPPQTSKAQQPKIDATDRRQIEALNEDKSITTKETLDDIKRIHRKE